MSDSPEFLAPGQRRRQRRLHARSIADLLCDLMARDGLSQRGLAKAIGVSPNTVSRLIRGPDEPTEETLEKIAQHAELDITEVRQIAGRPAGEVEHFTLPRQADQLGPRERALVRELVSVLVGHRVNRY